jgi:DNA recombination protein RmuC
VIVNELLMYGPVALPATAILLLLAVLYRLSRSALLLGARLDAFEKSMEMTARVVKDEIGQGRIESARMLGDQRREMADCFRELAGGVLQRMTDAHCAQARQFDALTAQFSDFARSNQEQLVRIEKQAALNARSLREEVVATLTKISESMNTTLRDLATAEKVQLDAFSGQLAELTKVTSGSLDAMRVQASGSARELREESVRTLTGSSETTARTMGELGTTQKSQLDAMAAAMNQLSETNAAKLETVRAAVETRLKTLQDDNARQLENMRRTVDEKLQGTLEKRLGESFRQVSERLEQVHKGLGEMQTLATGVGDLKKVLTNVKTRGTWGEVQLGALLEQVLSTEQYVRNASTRDGAERVEFAVKLPGQDGETPVLLPIDAKFPVEDYQRLLDAQERGDASVIETAGRQLETRVKACAKDIRDKYVNPPASTDFGILFLPIEGLFAEVIRRPGLAEGIQRDCRVVIAGPTTLWSILNSLQMGFRTLAIQKRSGEVWTLLGAVKTEWTKYGEVLDAVQKRIHQASETIEKAKVRTRAIGRKLRSVQELPAEASTSLLALPMDDEDGDLVVEVR